MKVRSRSLKTTNSEPRTAWYQMKLFPTERTESTYTRLWRFVYNILPAIRGTGSWLTFMSADWKEAHVRLPLSLRTRNYVGTIFGGALFAATDPIYMVMLIKVLGGENYVVWDKTAKIRFLQPGKGKLKAHFFLEESLVDKLKEQVAEHNSTNHTFTITWLNQQDKPVARIEKTVYIGDRKHYEAKRAARGQVGQKVPKRF